MSKVIHAWINRTKAVARYVVLWRQLSQIRKIIARFSHTETGLLAQTALRELSHIESLLPVSESDASVVPQAATPTGESFARVSSDNTRIQLHGIAQWLAAVYMETRHALSPELQDIHREMMREFRLLREHLAAVKEKGTQQRNYAA